MQNPPFTTEDNIPQDILTAATEGIPAFFDAATLSQGLEGAKKIAKALGANEQLTDLFLIEPVGDFAKEAEKRESKLVSSFRSNLELLIHKTWVEKSDAELKQQLLLRLDTLISCMEDKKYIESLEAFLPVLYDTVYLLFGQQARTPDFAQYAIRIDPDFGFFWWYALNLKEHEKDQANEKVRVALLLGMFFLSNF